MNPTRTRSTPDTDPVPLADQSHGRTSDDTGIPATLLLVDPRKLVVDTNVRTDVELDRDFVASIRDHGVLVPIVAWRTPDGELRVRMGQLRTLGAVEAGRDLVPVYVVDTPGEDEAAQIARIVEQLVENNHRRGLRDADQVGAYQQLALLGLRAGQIARQARVPVRSVKAALQITASTVATAAMQRYDLTVEQAAAVAEFDSDPEAVKLLTVTARKQPGQFPHVCQRLRDERDERDARQAVLDSIAESGTRIIEQADYAYGSQVERLDRLRPTPADEPGSTLTVEAHAACPGHAAFVHERYGIGASERFSAVHVCTDWRDNGHARSGAPAGEADHPMTAATPARASGPMTVQQKTERRRVIANNKAWDSATVVRRRWLSAFCGRKAAPKDAPQWIARVVAAGYPEITRSMEGAHPLASNLLGLDVGRGSAYQYRHGRSPHPIAEAADRVSAARATVLVLAMLLCGLEQSTSRETWRTPTAAQRVYLDALRHWGYELSDVELLALGERDTESAEPAPEPDSVPDGGEPAERGDEAGSTG